MRIDQDISRDLQNRRFGRREGYSTAAIAAPSGLASDIRLFALTFAGGFLFMTIFLA